MTRARPRLVRAAQREEAEQYATCRALRHAWDPIGRGPRIPQFGSLVCLRCTRCGTLRYDKFSRMSGVRLAPPSYDYPEGYKASEAHDMAWWRATWASQIDPDLIAGDEVKPRRRSAS